MRWLILSLALCATTAAEPELRCDPPQCTALPQDNQWLSFEVNDEKIKIFHEERFHVRCLKSRALESPAAPRFSGQLRVSLVVLEDCPLPANTTIADTLARLNVTLQPIDGKTELRLRGIPSTPQLDAHHFSGLEHLTNLSITAQLHQNPDNVSAGFLSGLRNLRYLSLNNLEMETGVFQRLPRMINSLYVRGYSLINLKGLIQEVVAEISSTYPELRSLTLDTPIDNRWPTTLNETRVYDNQTRESSIETLSLYRWKEERYTPLERCKNLRKFETIQPNVVEFPDRFVAACPLFEELRIYSPRKLLQLPAKLLEGATALKSFSIRKSKLEMLPENLFQDSPNLSKVDLSENRLKVLPSLLFVGVPLKSLSLNYNYLKFESLNALAPLTSLTKLRLQSNDMLSFCWEYGSEFSPLRNKTQLKTLELSHIASVRQICRDWREDLVNLEYLDLSDTDIYELKYADLQFTRDASVKDAVVLLNPRINIIFTKDDYENSLKAPASVVRIQFGTKEFSPNASGFHNPLTRYHLHKSAVPTCDCSKYWLRRAMDDASHAVKIEGYSCSNGRKLKDMTPEQLCHENKETNSDEYVYSDYYA